MLLRVDLSSPTDIEALERQYKMYRVCSGNGMKYENKFWKKNYTWMFVDPPKN